MDFGPLRQAQVAELDSTRNELANIRRRREQARDTLYKYQQVTEVYTEMQIEEARIRFQEEESNYKQALAALSNLESQFIDQSAKRGVDLADLQSRIAGLRIQIEDERLKQRQARTLLDNALMSARAAERDARRIHVRATASGNVLLIRSPVTGVVTNINYNQAGDKVPATTPLLTIAPQQSRKILKINIPEKDRAFLDEGQVVKTKFAAFPYQRYGFVDGTLDFISPTVQQTEPGVPLMYEGHVSLDTEFIEVGVEQRPLRYGMSATAEVVVRQRRLIDMAFDPFRDE